MKMVIYTQFNRLLLVTLLFGLTTCQKEDPAPKPVAFFTYSPTTNLVAPVTLTLTNGSTDATEYLWQTSTGLSSTAKDVTWTIPTAGTYTISLKATGKGGSDTYSRTVTVGTAPSSANPTQPTAGFTYSPSSNLVAPVMVTFNNTSANATSYKWDFGDGTTSTTANPSKQFTTSGTYTVKLTATGAGGSAETSTSIGVAKAAASTGQIVFWTDQSSGWSSIDVTVGGTAVGSITGYSSSAPACGTSKVVTVTAAPGTYAYSAKSNTGVTWSGNITINANQCNTWKLTFPVTSTCDWTAWSKFLEVTSYKYTAGDAYCKVNKGYDGSTRLYVRNNSTVGFDIKICLKRPDGTWDCGIYATGSGNENWYYTCGQAQGYWIAGRPFSASTSCQFPNP